jgi:hypothetical protein
MPAHRSLLVRLLASATLVASLTTAASAEIARVPNPPPQVASVPAQFAQPPHVRVNPADPHVAPLLTRAAVRDALIKARHRNLSAFRQYQKKGVFPSNTFSDKTLNVWRDADGHFCAAATIIRSSDAALVDRVAEQNNFIRLANVTQGPLMDWILTSGFTQEEIDAIQAPFVPVSEPKQPQIVDARRRKAEDARLRAKYKVVDRMLVANENKSLEIAVDRLMKHPDLAWKIASAESSPAVTHS